MNLCKHEMKTIISAAAFFFLFLVVSGPSPGSAYPHTETSACMASALNAVVVKGLKADYSQVENYCDCSLRRIMDEGRDINASLAYCNKKYLF